MGHGLLGKVHDKKGATNRVAEAARPGFNARRAATRERPGGPAGALAATRKRPGVPKGDRVLGKNESGRSPPGTVPCGDTRTLTRRGSPRIKPGCEWQKRFARLMPLLAATTYPR